MAISKSKIEKREEKLDHFMDSMNKVLFGFLPGGNAAEVFLNYRNDLKTKRALTFIENFSLALSEIYAENEISVEDFTNEDFVDVFDAIISKIQHTKSEIKLARFQSILLNQCLAPEKDYLISKYISLIDELNEIQIMMLDKIAVDVFAKTISNIPLYFQPKNHDHKLYPPHVTIIEITGERIEIEKSELEFLFTELVSKGLINHTQKERKASTTQFIARSFDKSPQIDQTYKVTNFGLKFLEILKNTK